MSEATRRLFVALWPSDELRHQIEHETRHAARHSGGRVIPTRNLHITLAFLGSVTEAQVAEAVACVRETNVPTFEVILGELKFWARQALLCLEPAETDQVGAAALTELVGRLHTALRAKGFAIERRPFRAHLTLARDVRREREFKPIKQLHWQVHRMELVESKTLSRGSEYTVLPT